MKIMVLHNAYRIHGGEDTAVEREIELLRGCGHDVLCYWRSSAEISQLRLGRLRACVAGIISPSSKATVRQRIREFSPAVARVHNLFPLISPSVLPELRDHGVPVVMTVHNYRLTCPTGLHMSRRTLTACDKCCGGREYWCALLNCEGDISKSIGYALRNWVARRRSFFLRGVALYVCLTQFQRQRLIDEGFPAHRITVLANMAENRHTGSRSGDNGAYVGYAGRISPEKGIDTLLAAARSLPSIPFQVAGSYEESPHLVRRAPENLQFLGFLDRENIPSFMAASRFMVLCSTWYEGFPMAVVEAMMAAKAVVAPRVGGIPEIVDDGVTGLLFVPGDAEELADRIRCLWDSPKRCRDMGLAARDKALREYSRERYYERLMTICERAIKLGPPCCGGESS